MIKKEITSYKSVKEQSETEEFVINKSRFIGYAASAMTEEEAKAFISHVHELHPEAACICHGYVCGMSGQIQRFEDGHEPVGGMPILEAIKMKGLTATACAVVRYFGGVKLGVGGLARAFTGAAVKAIDMAKPCVYELSEKYLMEYDYTYQGKIEYMLGNTHYILGKTQYTEKLSTEITVKLGEYEKLNAHISAITSGNHKIKLLEKEYIAWDD